MIFYLKRGPEARTKASRKPFYKPLSDVKMFFMRENLKNAKEADGL